MKKIISSILVFAMLLTLAPAALAAADYSVSFGSTTFEVEPGGVLNVPVYIKLNAGGDTSIAMLQTTILTPEGFTDEFELVSGGMAAGDVTLQTEGVQLYNDSGVTFKDGVAAVMIKYTAPTTPGTYPLTFSEETFLIDSSLNVIESVEVIGATITVKDAEPEKTLESIKAASSINVPEGTTVDEAYIKANIGDVKAVYSDGSEETITDYSVSVSENKAIINYNGKTAEITINIIPVSTADYQVKFGATSYEVAAGGVLNVPVYIVATAGGDTSIAMLQTTILTPEGFTDEFELVSGGMAAGDVTLQTEGVQLYNDSGVTFKDGVAAVMIKYTAPATPGTYTLAFSEETFLIDSSLNVIESVEIIGATITVTGSAPTKVVDSIAVNPTSMTVPYDKQSDIEAYVKENITGVTVSYTDSSSDVITSGYDVAVSGTTATVTYEGKTADIALTLEPAPKTLTAISSSVTEITVPYGTADVKAYAEANVGTITATYSDSSTETVTDYTAAYSSEDANVVVTYNGKDVTIPVTVVTLSSIAVTGDVEVPFGTEDVAAYVAAHITAIGTLSDATTIDLTGKVTVAVDEATCTASYDGVTSDSFTITYGVDPSGVKAIDVVEDSIVVPYENKDAVEDYIKSKITVNATLNDDTVTAVTGFEVAVADGVATVSYNGFTDTLSVSVVERNTGLKLSVDTLDVPYAQQSDIAAYIKANVKAYFTFTLGAADVETEYDVTVNGTTAQLSADGETAELTLTLEPAPEFVADEITQPDDTTKVYGIENSKLVVISDVAAGKVPYVNGVPAKYAGNGKYALVVTGSAAVITVKEEAAPAAISFGRLHLSDMVTALDALMANNVALNKIANVFTDDMQQYIVADLNGDGVVDAIDAKMINDISLGKTVSTWID